MTWDITAKGDGLAQLKELRKTWKDSDKVVLRRKRPVGAFTKCGHDFVWVVSPRPDVRHGAIDPIPCDPYHQSLVGAMFAKW